MRSVSAGWMKRSAQTHGHDSEDRLVEGHEPPVDVVGIDEADGVVEVRVDEQAGEKGHRLPQATTPAGLAGRKRSARARIIRMNTATRSRGTPSREPGSQHSCRARITPCCEREIGRGKEESEGHGLLDLQVKEESSQEIRTVTLPRRSSLMAEHHNRRERLHANRRLDSPERGSPYWSFEERA